MTSGGEPRDTADGGTPDASAPRAEADVTRVRPRLVWLLTAGTIALAACIVIEIVTSTGSIPTVRGQLVALAALLALKTPLAWRALSGLPRLWSWARSRDLSRNALARACVIPGAVFVAGRLIASSPPWIEHLALLTAFLCVLVVDALPGRVLKSAGAVAGLLGSLIVIWAFDFDARVAPIGVDSFQAVFQTDPRESWQFVAAHADRQLAQLLTALLVAHAMLLGQRMVAAQRGDRDRLTRQVTALAAAALLVLASGQLAARALRLAGNLRASIADFRAQRDLFLASRAQFDQPAANLSAPATPTDLVVYIGESTTRHHMSVYGYPRNTTPFLVSAQSDLIVFANATAPHSHTVRSLVEMLTDLNFDGSAGLQLTAKHAQAAGAAPFVLIDVLKSHGVPSWWFSNHNRFGLWDNPVADLGMRADHTKFYRTSVGIGFATVSYDDAMIEDATALLRRDDPGSRAIFLHSYAGHEDYCKNIPPPWRDAFAGFGVPPLAYFGKAPANQARVDCYDAAIRCIDDYLRRVVETARASRRQTIVIYVADHGEDVDNGSGHDSELHTYQHLAVPLIVYFNPAAQAAHGAQIARLRANSGSPFETADLYHLALDLMGVGEPYVDPSRSPAAESFRVRPRRVLSRGIRWLALDEDDLAGDLDLRDPMERALARVRRLSEADRSKLCVHHVNTLGKLREAKLLLPCVEFDAVYDAAAGKFFIHHLPDPSIGLDLDTYLTWAGPIRLWMDLKNPDERTIEAMFGTLAALDPRYGLHDRMIIEIGGDFFPGHMQPEEFRRLAGSWQTSLYLPTDKGLRCRDPSITVTRECVELEARLADSFRRFGFRTISFGSDLYPWVRDSPALSSLPLLSWSFREVIHRSDLNFRDGELYRRSQVFLIPMASAYSWGTYDCCDRPDYH